MDIALVSCRQLPEPDPDAAPLLDALRAAGLQAEILAWDDPQAPWGSARAAVLRSCWNYPQHADAFMKWAETTATRTRLLNPLPLVRWNIHKRYLLDLERAGVPVAPTVLVPRGEDRDLAALLSDRGWQDIVVKPAVSAASYRTMRFSSATLEEGHRHLQKLTADGDTLVQEYLPAVEDYGERALMWVDGALTHAIRKTPRFRGQHETVSTAPMPISGEEARLAEQTLDALAGIPGLDGQASDLLYARIDMAPDAQQRPIIMELELMEPSLFFLQGPVALERYVAGLLRFLES